MRWTGVAFVKMSTMDLSILRGRSCHVSKLVPAIFFNGTESCFGSEAMGV